MEEDQTNDLVLLNVSMDDLNNSDIRLTDVVSFPLESNPAQDEDEDLSRLRRLLEDWHLLQVLPLLQGSGVTYRSLVYLSKDDIKDAISDIGLRAEFRSKLFRWRKIEHNIDDDTITYDSKVGSWLEKTLDPKTPSSATSVKSVSKLSKDLRDLLNESNKGRAILQHYQSLSSLDKLRRDDLVSIILEDIQYNGCYLSPKDYPPILNEIESVFPTEKNFLDYYFFSRKKRENPGGRLYNKFINSTTKIRKIEGSSHATSSVESPTLLESQEFDINILNSLKTSLQRDITNSTEVKDKWEKSFVLRQQELKKSDKVNVVEFLKEWPLYSHANSKYLVDIDFRILFPGKDILLYSKWEQFKQKIKLFYATNIKDKSCKQLFSSLNSQADTNTEDYILATLLNSVILPTGRFAVEKGNNKRKVTINDAQESFTIRIPTINDFDHSISELRTKHYNKGLTLQPIIIVVGLSADQITDYFVYFDKCRQRHDSYLSCIDTCFKLFHVLCLEYPQASYGPWYFIQKYFFNIETEYDKPLPSVSSLIAYLNTE